jgi:hypothetical protein
VKREVLPARSFTLELVSIVAAALSLVCCAEFDTRVESVWQCSSTLVCEDKSYTVTPSTACVAPEDVEERYEEQELAYLRMLGLDCPDADLVDVACEDTGKPCVP